MAGSQPISVYEEVNRLPQPRRDWIFYIQTAAALSEVLRRGASPVAHKEFWNGVTALHAAVSGAAQFERWRPEEAIAWRQPTEKNLIDEALSKMYAEGRISASSDGLFQLVGCVFDLLEHNRVADLDSIFSRAEISRLAPEYIIALLRSTFVERDSIPAWAEFAHRAEADLVARGRADTDELLQGLLRRA